MSSQIDDLKRHIDLHHKDFKKLCVANFLFAVSAYMMLPILLLWTNDILLLDRCQGALGLLAFGIGTFSLGGFCSLLLRNQSSPDRLYHFDALACIVIGGFGILFSGVAPSFHSKRSCVYCFCTKVHCRCIFRTRIFDTQQYAYSRLL